MTPFKDKGCSPMIPDWHLENATTETVCCLGGQCERNFGWTDVQGFYLDNSMEVQSKGYISRVSVRRGGLWRMRGLPS